MSTQKLNVVIIGGVACGPKAAARIKFKFLDGGVICWPYDKIVNS